MTRRNIWVAATACAWAACAAEQTPPTPPHEHPRLYLRPADAADLERRLHDPSLADVVRQLQASAQKSEQMKIEWDALRWLAGQAPQAGRATVEAALAFLQASTLPDQHDACRVTGRAMVTGAIVYDWLYPLLRPEEKQAFISELVRLAKTQECGYPPTRQGSVTGHASEAMIMRDMLSAGVAIYDEFPDMYNLAAGRFFREHLPARNWLYNGHAYHQGDSYGEHRFSWDTYPLFIFDRLGARQVYNPAQRFVPYFWIYSTRPDGQRFRAGDTFTHDTRRGDPWKTYIGTLLIASYYGDGTVLDHFQRQGCREGNEAIFDLLWRDMALKPEPVTNLPTARYFGPPYSWMEARTGWGRDAAAAEMKINEYNFANHQHLDAGAFQLFYKGALAIDSGLYSGSSGQYGSPHCRNYYWRTIAHNALLVYDPDEAFDAKGQYRNDGGQRLPNGRAEPKNLESLLAPESGYRTGEATAHGIGPDARRPDYALLQGDLTRAYSPKVKTVKRSFVFLNLHDRQVPAALVVFDRVASADPSFRKSWLLHTQEEPALRGNGATVACTRQGEGGRLNLDVLLPGADDLDMHTVGGDGKAFWVFGKNEPNEISAALREKGSHETGAWRIEVSPKRLAAENLFLTLMQVTDAQGGARWPVRKLEAAGHVGCLLQGPACSWLALFREDSARSEQPVRFRLPDGKPCRVLVADLAAGGWTASRTGESATTPLTAADDSGAVWFEAQPGEWTLRRTGDR